MVRRDRRGFTLVELMVVLTILGILLAAAVPSLTAYLHLAQFRRNESYAKSIYLSAESTLTYYRGSGQWDSFARQLKAKGVQVGKWDTRLKPELRDRLYAIRLDAEEYGSGESLSDDGALTARLLANDTYDKSTLNGGICLEIDLESGQVYSAFYGAPCDGLRYDREPDGGDGWLNLSDRAYDSRKAVRLGYYSADDVTNVVDLELTKLKITSISLVNSETLSLSWSSNSKNHDHDVVYQLKFFRAGDNTPLLSTELKRPDGSAPKQITLEVDNQGNTGRYTFPLSYDDGRFTLELDAMMTAELAGNVAATPADPATKTWFGTSITRFGGAFADPMDIYATVQVLPASGSIDSEYTVSNEARSNTANTLFTDGSTAAECGIAAFRHLSNIRYQSGAGDQTFRITARTLDWTSDSVTVYRSVTRRDGAGTVVGTQLTRVDDPAFPTIPELRENQTLNGSGGSLLGRVLTALTGSSAVVHVKLDETSVVPGSADYLGLFGKNSGTITELRLTAPNVTYTARPGRGSVRAVGAVCGYATGSLQNVTVDGDAVVTVDLSQAERRSIGGLVGLAEPADGRVLSGLSMAGTVNGTVKSGTTTADAAGIGGIVGYLALTPERQLADSENLANVTGDFRVGGVAGYVTDNANSTGAAPSTVSLTNCANQGLVLGADSASDYVGGIAGYTDGAILDQCTSRSGRSTGFAYTADQTNLLMGRYVGGIVGYGNNSYIRDCATQADGYILGGRYVGGIAGGLAGSTQESIQNQTVSVTANASYVIGNDYVGGIVGENTSNSSIENCVNTGVVAGYGKYIGGICGTNIRSGSGVPTVKNCASYVSDTDNSIYQKVLSWKAVGSCAGGLVGFNSGDIIFNDEGNHITTRSVSGIVVGKDYVGGLVGFNAEGGNIQVSYTLLGGRVAASGDCVGGLIGLNAAEQVLTEALTIQPGSVQGRYYVGGAIGANVVKLRGDLTMDSMVVKNQLGTVSGQAFTGGLIGYHRTYAAGQLDGMTMEEYLAAQKDQLLPAIEPGTNIPKADALFKTANPYVLTVTQKDSTAAINNMGLRGYAYVGGVVGGCEDGSRLVLKDCVNTGGFAMPTVFENSDLAKGVDVVALLNAEGYAGAAKALEDELNKTALRARIVGGVIGMTGRNHVVDGCSNTGAMNGLSVLGGVVGLNEGYIVNCTLSNNLGGATQDYVGGIAGLNVGAKDETVTVNGYAYIPGTVSRCVTQAKRTVTGQNVVGGIVGCNLSGGRLEHNTSNASVTGRTAVGGVVGENQGVLTLSGPAGSEERRVTGQSGSSAVGGVIGRNTAGGSLVLSGSGDVAVTDGKLTVSGTDAVGGVIGLNRGTIQVPNDAYLTNRAKEVRAVNGSVGGVIGAQDGAGMTLSRAKNLGDRVTAQAGSAGGIVGVNRSENTVKDCVNQGSVINNQGYAGGIVSENYGTVTGCSVRADSGTITIGSRGADASGAICAVNHSGGTVTGSAPGTGVQFTGTAAILGAVVGDNYGTVRDTTVERQPEYRRVTPSSLTVGGAVGRNNAGGGEEGIINVKVKADFTGFTKYQYLGGVVGENCEDAQVKSSSYTGTIDEGRSAAGNCYGGVAGLNEGVLDGCTVSQLTITATGTYTATATSTAAQKEARSSHIGGIAGKNETTGEIVGCTLTASAGKPGTITAQYGMVGGVTGYNKGSISLSGDGSTSTMMAYSTGSGSVEKISQLLERTGGLSADAAYLRYNSSVGDLENAKYSNGTAVTANRTMKVKVTGNGNLGGIAGYNAPTGQLDHCVSGSWFLENKSGSLGVGTGGIIGMNESEKDLTFLVNRAFVGRYLSSGQTNRFAGGIIGNQVNSTTENWTIRGCVNYGTVYCYNSHYSGGILGQWTGNGGTIQDCYNYGNMQTTYGADWIGASGGIVAQLYHGTSGQSFNVVGCQNHGNIYMRDGTQGSSSNRGANDSAGILGNVTTYGAAQMENGQKFSINVVDCVNGVGVQINSASMASGIVGFLSCDNAGAATIKNSTQNVVLNIDRCRNYTTSLSGKNFAAGIFGDRYGDTGMKNTYLQNCYSVMISGGRSMVSMTSGGNSQSPVFGNVGNNYYFDARYSLGQVGVNPNIQGEISIDNNTYNPWKENVRAGTRQVHYGQDAENRWMALCIAPGDDIAGNVNNQNDIRPEMYCGATTSNTYLDEGGAVHANLNGGRIVAAQKLFDIPQDYNNEVSRNDSTFVSQIVKQKSEFDLCVRDGYRLLERTTATGGKLAAPNTVTASLEDDGSIQVNITQNSRPLYYEGKLVIDGQDVMTGLRFFPNQKDQGKWNGNTERYGSGITTGSFQIPDALREQVISGNVTLQVRAVSINENIGASEWQECTLTNNRFLPTPELRIQLRNSNGNHNTYLYRYELTNAASYGSFSGWKVTMTAGGSTYTFQNGTTYFDRTALGVHEAKLVASAPEQAATKETPTPVTVNISVYTPGNNTYGDNFRPDVTLDKLNAVFTGDNLDDLVITAQLTAKDKQANVSPIYRAELLGTIDGTEVVLAHQNVMIASGTTVTADFDHLPVQIFDAEDLRVRAWYASPGLGPVYTYGPTIGDESYSRSKVTMRTYAENGSYEDESFYSVVLWEQCVPKWDAVSRGRGCLLDTPALGLTKLAQPVLDDITSEMKDGSLLYTFQWDQGTNAPNAAANARYRVKLIGETAGGQVTIPTDYDESAGARTLTVNADDWSYTNVTLTVTRVGDVTAKKIGLSAARTYPVQSRLERPGQPTVENVNTNELNYRVSWPAISNETGCTGYAIHLQYPDDDGNPVDTVLATVPADGSAAYSRVCDLEPYSGKEVLIYLVALADANHKDSANGVSFTLVVPERVGAPTVTWSTNWTYDRANPVPAGNFRGGGLSVTVRPQNAASIPPGGSTYLLRAKVYDSADGSGPPVADYPASGVLAMSADSDGSYVLWLNDLSVRYAGKYIQFQARISSSAGQVSSPWVTSDICRLPAMRLDTPGPITGSQPVETKVSVRPNPDLPASTAAWTAQRTTVTWTVTEPAEVYELSLNQGAAVLRIGVKNDAVVVRRKEGDGWTNLTPDENGLYTVLSGETVDSTYVDANGTGQTYSYVPETTLRGEEDEDGRMTFTLYLPNISAMTGPDVQSITLPEQQKQVESLDICANVWDNLTNSPSDAYVVSEKRELEF